MEGEELGLFIIFIITLFDKWYVWYENLDIHIFETENLKEYSRLIYIHATLSLTT